MSGQGIPYGRYAPYCLPPPIRLGLIGGGRWGERLAENIRADPRFDLLGTAAHREDPWRELFNRSDYDAVVAAVPPAMHLKLAEEAARTGIPLWLEKPMATSVEDGRTIYELSERVPIFVDHTYLFSPAWRVFREWARVRGVLRLGFESGGPGPVREGGLPYIWDWGAHDIAMALDLMDAASGTQLNPIRWTGLSKTTGTLNAGCAKLRGKIDDVELSISISNILDKRTRRAWFHVDASWDDTQMDPLALYGQGVRPLDTRTPLQVALHEFAELARSGKPTDRYTSMGLRVVQALHDLTGPISDAPSSAC